MDRLCMSKIPSFETVKKSRVLCSLHFEENSFVNRSLFNMGMANRLVLHSTAVRTVRG